VQEHEAAAVVVLPRPVCVSIIIHFTSNRLVCIFKCLKKTFITCLGFTLHTFTFTRKISTPLTYCSVLYVSDAFEGRICDLDEHTGDAY